MNIYIHFTGERGRSLYVLIKGRQMLFHVLLLPGSFQRLNSLNMDPL